MIKDALLNSVVQTLGSKAPASSQNVNSIIEKKERNEESEEEKEDSSSKVRSDRKNNMSDDKNHYLKKNQLSDLTALIKNLIALDYRSSALLTKISTLIESFERHEALMIAVHEYAKSRNLSLPENINHTLSKEITKIPELRTLELIDILEDLYYSQKSIKEIKLNFQRNWIFDIIENCYSIEHAELKSRLDSLLTLLDVHLRQKGEEHRQDFWEKFVRKLTKYSFGEVSELSSREYRLLYDSLQGRMERNFAIDVDFSPEEERERALSLEAVKTKLARFEFEDLYQIEEEFLVSSLSPVLLPRLSISMSVYCSIYVILRLRLMLSHPKVSFEGEIGGEDSEEGAGFARELIGEDILLPAFEGFGMCFRPSELTLDHVALIRLVMKTVEEIDQLDGSEGFQEAEDDSEGEDFTLIELFEQENGSDTLETISQILERIEAPG